ncbi:MAG TPA: YcnI family protein [Pilimelia sp.]|nr:YcnI family protein [Pilimelia sp.]
MIRLRTVAAATLLGLVGVSAVASPAAAHVTVSPKEATQGGYARVAFRVPNESDTASTTKLEVALPEQTPIASVSVQPVPGWTVKVDKGKPATPVKAHGTEVTEVVTRITWTAAGGTPGVRPGEFQEFPVSLGPLPEVDRLVFKALQTYSDGTVVRWIEEPADGGEHPEHPAPVLTLTKAGAGGGGEADDDHAAGGDSDHESSTPALVLAVVALVVALAGAALGGLAFARVRRRS